MFSMVVSKKNDFMSLLTIIIYIIFAFFILSLIIYIVFNTNNNQIYGGKMEKIEVGERLNEVTNKIAKLMGNVEFMQRKCSKLGRVECNLLHILLHTNSIITMKELAGKLGVTHSRITHLIDSLERKDLVVRKQSDTDRRIFYTQINDKGKKMVEKYTIESVDKYNKMLSKLTDNERLSIYEALNLWLNLLKKMPQKNKKKK